VALDASFWVNLATNVGTSAFGAATKNRAANQSIQAFETAAEDERVAAAYNADLARRASDRRVKSLVEDRNRAIGTQRVQASAQGFALGSKSTMMLMNEGLDRFQQALLSERTDFRTEEAMIKFEGESRARQRLAQAHATRTRNQSDLLGSVLSVGKDVGTILQNTQQGPSPERKRSLGNNIAFVKREL